jgi:hypothetical protein
MPENPVRSELQKLPGRLLAEINVSPSPSTANDRSAPMESADFFPLNPRFAEIMEKTANLPLAAAKELCYQRPQNNPFRFTKLKPMPPRRLVVTQCIPSIRADEQPRFSAEFFSKLACYVRKFRR